MRVRSPRTGLVVITLLLLLVVGCTHSFETKKLDEQTFSEEGAEGVLFYQPQYVKITHAFTRRVDDQGRLIAVASPTNQNEAKCEPIVQKEEIQLLPDLRERYVILNRPKAFSSGKLTVSLSNGMLQSVNTESKPGPIGSELVKATGTVAAAAAPAAVADVPDAQFPDMACNAGPQISGFEVVTLEEAHS